MNFTKILERWYEQNKRDLPWRRTRDPYRIWVSEIILQQTRIDQGTEYYLRFIEKFPDIHSLAEADEETVLKLWQGLGYYSRARNMHAAAREIMALYHGKFPRTYDDIRKLKGVGDYTAAAIASIAFRIPSPVVDGNVLRFFSRYFGIHDPVDKAKGKAIVREKVKQLISHENPGNFNEAIMEFGALLCKPVPDCKICPFKSGCKALRSDKISSLPVKSKKQNQRIRFFHFLVITTRRKKDQYIFIKKRTENDIWKNLFDFPLIERERDLSYKDLTGTKEWKDLFTGKKVELLNISQPYPHILTHQVIKAKFFHLEVSPQCHLPYPKVAIRDIRNYPVPKLIENYLEVIHDQLS
jgi:A/G-specific adenine glycosylase